MKIAQETGDYAYGGLAGGQSAPPTHTLYSNSKASSVPFNPPNHRGRSSEYIGSKQALDLIASAAHARIIGMPLNLFVTINFETGQLEHGIRGQEALSAWLKRAGQWLALRGVKLTYIWVLEHASGAGLHAHIMLHCPNKYQAEFRELGRKSWAVKAGMQPATGERRNAIFYEKIGPRGYDGVNASPHHHQTYYNQLKGLLKYHLKAINPEEVVKLDEAKRMLGEFLGVEENYSLRIYGRRLSRSENISKKARDAYHEERAATRH